MKKDNLIRSYVLTLILVIIGLVIGLFSVKKAIRVNKGDAIFVKLAQRQATLSEQIVKSAGLFHTEKIIKSELNFDLVKKQVRESLTEFEKTQKALIRGDASLGISKVENSVAVLAKMKETDFTFREMRDAGRELTRMNYSETEATQSTLKIATNNLLNVQSTYRKSMEDIADLYQEEAKENKGGFTKFIMIISGSVIAVLLLQASFIFRPAVNLAYKNFLTSNEAFVELQKSEKKLKRSEEELRSSVDNQLEMNEKLMLSQRALEKRNSKLKVSEQEALKSSREKTKTNEKLIRVQEELKKAYGRVKYSEERMRSITEEQLENTEKLIIAEDKLKQTIDVERRSKDDLSQIIENLKSTQSQLVQSEKMASLGQLTAGIAHEINNPINFVYNGIDTLKISLDDLFMIIEKYDELENTRDFKGAMSEINEMKKEYAYDELLGDLKELVADIKKGAERTIDIVKGLRVFSRLDEEEMKPANMNESLDATLILLRNKTKNIINIKKFYDESIEEINCFPGQLNQVFMNILNNGIQAIPEGKKGGEIQIYTENQDQHIIVKIKDNGSGMSEQVKRRIFEPFFTTKPVGIGTGLGMSISYGIIEKHGGNICCNSEEEKGTEFSILIPKHMEQ